MDKEASARFNARLAITSSFIADLTFILPVWLLYSLYTLKYSPTLSIAIFMSIWVTSALLEVPTGALADRLGRKKIFIIGQFLFALYPLAYAFKFPVILLVLTALISAVGSAMRSGALIPIVHRSYGLAGLDENKYNNFLSNNQTASFIARALTGVTGAALYSINPTWPFFAMFIATMANFTLGFFIRSPGEDTRSKSTNTQHIKQTINAMKKSEIITLTLVSFIFFNLVAESVWTGYQVFFENDGRNALTIGALFSLIAMLSASGAYAVRFISKRIKPFRIIQAYGAGILLTTILLLQPNIGIRLIAVVPMAIVSGMTIFTLTATMQKQIDNKFHSTAMSVINFVQYATYAIGSVTVGALIQFLGIQKTRAILLVISLTVFILISSIALSKKRASSFLVNSQDKAV